METIMVMSQRGHDEWKYNPDNKDEVKDIKKKVREYIKKGYMLYAYKASTKNYKLFDSEKQLDGEDFDRYILAAGEKKIMAAPVGAG